MSIINNHVIDQTADGKWFVVFQTMKNQILLHHTMKLLNL